MCGLLNRHRKWWLACLNESLCNKVHNSEVKVGRLTSNVYIEKLSMFYIVGSGAKTSTQLQLISKSWTY